MTSLHVLVVKNPSTVRTLGQLRRKRGHLLIGALTARKALGAASAKHCLLAITEPAFDTSRAKFMQEYLERTLVGERCERP